MGIGLDLGVAQNFREKCWSRNICY